MSSPFTKPNKALLRELRAVARRAHDVEQAMQRANLLPDEFPNADIADLIITLEALPETPDDPGARPPLARGGVDQAIDLLISAISTARSEYERQAGELAGEESPVRSVRSDPGQAAVLGELDRQAGEIEADAGTAASSAPPGRLAEGQGYRL